ncbi:MAG: cob(I)yrinic acid a,c-diamide adenosyltransferase [Gemmatimonadaceae bacterium]|nr:cob(I)yrinic acid a,c-diamide adenosyltransferase [Gloeobacterales cyanobacterium ES-bin-141]
MVTIRQTNSPYNLPLESVHTQTGRLSGPPGEVYIHAYSERCFPTSVMVNALRLAAQGRPVLFAQLLMGSPGLGPERPISLGPSFNWVQPGITRTIAGDDVNELEASAVRALWAHICEQLHRFDYLVLDEVGLAIRYGLITEQQVVNLLCEKPPYLEVGLCGTAIPDTLAAFADHWTENRSMNAISWGER